MVSILLLIISLIFSTFMWTVSRASITISFVTFTFHKFFSFPFRFRYLCSFLAALFFNAVIRLNDKFHYMTSTFSPEYIYIYIYIYEGEIFFSHKSNLRSHYPQSGLTKLRVNGALHLIVCGQNTQVNGQNHFVQSGNYCYSSLRVASIDEVKKRIQPSKDYHDSHSIPYVAWVKKGRFLLRLELWPQCSKNLQQNSKTNKKFLNVKAQYSDI